MAAKPYVLLRRALERNTNVAVARFAWHNRERLGLLSVRDDALVLHSMKWPDEVRDPSEPAPHGIDLDKDEIRRAIELTDSMTTDDTTDDINGYRDHFREARKLVSRSPRPPGERGAPTPCDPPSSAASQ
ncbi:MULTISPECIES: Ku protein [unclassified Streptomyces]|uniref:Ku protein n=1 Tax=unclassified Streptomyces TaxID=2593676 RepID=UPI003666BB9A